MCKGKLRIKSRSIPIENSRDADPIYIDGTGGGGGAALWITRSTNTVIWAPLSYIRRRLRIINRHWNLLIKPETKISFNIQNGRRITPPPAPCCKWAAQLELLAEQRLVKYFVNALRILDIIHVSFNIFL